MLFRTTIVPTTWIMDDVYGWFWLILHYVSISINMYHLISPTPWRRLTGWSTFETPRWNRQESRLEESEPKKSETQSYAEWARANDYHLFKSWPLYAYEHILHATLWICLCGHVLWFVHDGFEAHAFERTEAVGYRRSQNHKMPMLLWTNSGMKHNLTFCFRFVVQDCWHVR